jgi:hypothetical protein
MWFRKAPEFTKSMSSLGYLEAQSVLLLVAAPTPLAITSTLFGGARTRPRSVERCGPLEALPHRESLALLGRADIVIDTATRSGNIVFKVATDLDVGIVCRRGLILIMVVVTRIESTPLPMIVRDEVGICTCRKGLMRSR